MYITHIIIIHIQVFNKLKLQALSSLKAGLKSGNEEHRVSSSSSSSSVGSGSGSGNSGPMVKALNAMAVFCDKALRDKEDGT